MEGVTETKAVEHDGRDCRDGVCDAVDDQRVIVIADARLASLARLERLNAVGDPASSDGAGEPRRRCAQTRVLRTRSWPLGPGRGARTVVEPIEMPAQPQEAQGPRAGGSPGGPPLIAVSTSEIRRSQTVAPTPRGEPPQHEMALGLKYLRAIEAGRRPAARRSAASRQSRRRAIVARGWSLPVRRTGS